VEGDAALGRGGAQLVDEREIVAREQDPHLLGHPFRSLILGAT
jgi:hypothetical protein